MESIALRFDEQQRDAIRRALLVLHATASDAVDIERRRTADRRAAESLRRHLAEIEAIEALLEEIAGSERAGAREVVLRGPGGLMHEAIYVALSAAADRADERSRAYWRGEATVADIARDVAALTSALAALERFERTASGR